MVGYCGCMKTQTTKICRFCKKEKSLKEMESFVKKGKRYFRSRCRDCMNEKRDDWHKRNPEKTRANQDRQLERQRQERKSGSERDKYIYRDSRGADRKAGRVNNLTREFIRAEIEKGCEYCGETSLRMTLDRIDNTRGHTMDNVVPACSRCNYLRKDMPYEAWLLVACGMREARERGLFKGWTGRTR